MKASHYYLRLFSKLLILIVLFQSCSIYRSQPVSVDKAVEFNRKVKLTTKNDQVFKFKSLEKEGGELFGIAGENSKAAKLMAGNIVEKNYKGKFVKIGIPEGSVEEVKQKNYLMSAMVPIAIGVAIFTGFLVLIAEALVVHPG